MFFSNFPFKAFHLYLFRVFSHLSICFSLYLFSKTSLNQLSVLPYSGFLFTPQLVLFLRFSVVLLSSLLPSQFFLFELLSFYFYCFFSHINNLLWRFMLANPKLFWGWGFLVVAVTAVPNAKDNISEIIKFISVVQWGILHLLSPTLKKVSNFCHNRLLRIWRWGIMWRCMVD